jgi:hypothetical protein
MKITTLPLFFMKTAKLLGFLLARGTGHIVNRAILSSDKLATISPLLHKGNF